MSIMTETLEHRWVKHTITEVAVLPDPQDDDQVVVIESDAQKEVAEAAAVYGCDSCGISMEGNVGTPCDPMCHCGANLSEHGPTENHDFKEMR